MPKDNPLSAILDLINEASSATRIEDGRIIPAHRFQLEKGSLRGVMANFAVSERAQTRAISSSGQRFVMSEIKHPVLKSIRLDPGLKALGVDTQASGPILTPTGGMILRDRSDPQLRWVKRAFEIVEPAAPVFRARKSGTAIDGSDLWAADLTLPVQLIRLAATERQIALAQQREPGLIFRDIPINLREATLKLPYQADDGRRVMELQGQVAEDKTSVTFSLSGDAISLAWKLLRESDDVRVQFLSDHVVYEAVEQPETAQTTKGDVRRVGDFFERSRTASIFGGRVRRENISRRRKADLAADAPRTKRFKSLKAGAARLRAALQGKARAKEPDLPAPVYAKQRMVTDIVHTLDFRGSDNDRLFVMRDPATRRDMRITRPPWVGHGAVIRELEELDGMTLGLPASLAARLTIYASLVDVGVYIVVPDVYVLGREPDSGDLQFFAKVVSDPMIPENSVVHMTFGLVPEIQPDEEVNLRAALERHLEQNSFGADARQVPKLLYPTDLGTMPVLSWGDPLSEADLPIIDGRAVLLSVMVTKLGFAKAVLDTLARRNQALGGQLVFGIPGARSARVSLLIGLTRTSGPTVRAEAAADAVHFTDLCGHPQRVSGLVRAKGFGEAQALDLSPPVSLDPDASAQSQPAGLVSGQWTAASEVDYPDAVLLDPERINVDQMVTAVIFTTRLEHGADLGGKALQSLSVEASLPGQDPLAVVMNPDADTGMFDAQIVRLALPFDRALSTTGRVLSYRVTAMFQDGSRHVTDWQTQDFGANPDVSITRALLEQ